jgi:hypothetical protein
MPVVSDALRELLQQRLSSLDQVEVVLLLRSDRARSFTAPEVAKALRTAPEPAAMRLFLLASGGLLTFEAGGIPRYRYVELEPETETLLAELERLYADDRRALTEVVETKPADPIRSFTDAFKLKK